MNKLQSLALCVFTLWPLGLSHGQLDSKSRIEELEKRVAALERRLDALSSSGHEPQDGAQIRQIEGLGQLVCKQCLAHGNSYVCVFEIRPDADCNLTLWIRDPYTLDCELFDGNGDPQVIDSISIGKTKVPQSPKRISRKLFAGLQQEMKIGFKSGPDLNSVRLIKLRGSINSKSFEVNFGKIGVVEAAK